MGEKAGEFKRVLDYKSVLLITINSLMGTGIFFLPVVGAAMAGPMSLISWIFASIICVYIAMCFAELVSMFPKAGGIYEYCKQAYGSFFSFLIGWTTLIVGNITIAMLIVGAVRYLNPALPNYIKIIVSVLFVLMFNFMAFKGVKTSAVMLVIFAIITLLALFALIIPGLIFFNPVNFIPFASHSWSTAFIAVFYIISTFFGWETISQLAEETKDPSRVIPKALIHGTIAIAGISILLSAVILSSIHWSLLSGIDSPMVFISQLFYGEKAAGIYTILIYLSIIGGVAGWIVSAPRLILALSEDKLFFRQCAKIHPKNGTPYIAIIFQTILTCLLVFLGAGSYETLLELLLPLVLSVYCMTLLCIPVLRIRQPKMERLFKVPFGMVGPIVVVLIFLSLLAFWIITVPVALGIVKLGASFLLTGIPIYFLLTLYYNPEAIQSVLDKFSHVKLITENIELPQKIRKEIFSLLGNIAGKNVLEHGCSIGTLTLELSEKVGPGGKVYATNISKGEIDVLQTRLNKNEIINVSALHDEHHSSRIHPSIPRIDVFVSVGTLGYTQDINKIAKEVHERLPIGGRIVVLEYVDLYKVIPNAGWLRHPEKIEEIFRLNGFLVRVVKKKSLLWNYLYIYGVKSQKSAVPFI